MRKKIIAGNWKMNKNLEEGMALASEVVNMVKDEYQGSAEVVLIPPLHIFLRYLKLFQMQVMYFLELKIAVIMQVVPTQVK